MWQQAMCHTHTPEKRTPPPLPYLHPSGIDQWTYSWPQNFATGHKLHKTKPNQTGVEAEEAAMKCIANALKFHKLCGPTPPPLRQGKSVHHTHSYSDFRRWPQCHAPCSHIHTYIWRTSVILAAVEKGIIAKVNSRQNGQWLWQRNGKISQLVTRTLQGKGRKRRGGRGEIKSEIAWIWILAKGQRGWAYIVRVIVAQNSRLVSEELTSGGRDKCGKKRKERGEKRHSKL